jgi:hypothetical protein
MIRQIVTERYNICSDYVSPKEKSFMWRCVILFFSVLRLHIFNDCVLSIHNSVLSCDVVIVMFFPRRIYSFSS